LAYKDKRYFFFFIIFVIFFFRRPTRILGAVLIAYVSCRFNHAFEMKLYFEPDVEDDDEVDETWTPEAHQNFMAVVRTTAHAPPHTHHRTRTRTAAHTAHTARA
jgi:hypothetical protein